MKLIFSSLFLVGWMLPSVSLFAQWSPVSTTNIYNTNTGNVGIGTGSSVAPQIKFEVVGFGQILRNTSATSYTTMRLFNNLNSGIRALEIDYSGNSYSASLLTGGIVGEAGSITTTGQYPLMFGTANTARMTILSNGQVGIGTSSPAAPLDVSVGSLWDGTIRANGTGYSSFGLYQNNSLRWAFYNHPGVNNALLFANSSGQDKVTFTQDGNVGIGTISPSSSLHVNGSNSSGLGLQVQNNATNGAKTFLTSFSGKSSIETDKDFTVATKNTSGVSSDKFVVKNDGNIGIGTTSPLAPLDVSAGSFWNRNYSCQWHELFVFCIIPE